MTVVEEMQPVLILTDGKAGHKNQSKAFARALGRPCDVIPVKFKSKFFKALSYLLDWLGVHTTFVFDDPGRLDGIDTTAYAAVLGTGSGTFYAAKTFARLFGVPCGVVLYPRGYRISTFDCVLAPSFDAPKKAPNVIEIPANLVANDAAFYEKGVAEFRALEFVFARDRLDRGLGGLARHRVLGSLLRLLPCRELPLQLFYACHGVKHTTKRPLPSIMPAIAPCL